MILLRQRWREDDGGLKLILATLATEGDTDAVEMLWKIPTPLLLWYLSIAQPNTNHKSSQWSADDQLSDEDLRGMSKHIVRTYGRNI